MESATAVPQLLYPGANASGRTTADMEVSRFAVPSLVIEARQSLFDLDLGAIWQRRELLYFLVWRDVKVRYKQTAIGAAWAVLSPLLTVLSSRWSSAVLAQDTVRRPCRTSCSRSRASCRGPISRGRSIERVPVSSAMPT